ncbi:protein FAM83H [Chelmon rostratus]|uniref:protein FAM83H n=1 Tax=Chelmon rostratus TaxID=109905 RepID=UPI001BE7CCE9|nr:protein FAM83H [Chelmon rostratus]
MARRSQCSSDGDNPLHPNYLPPHYREEYRLAIDALVEEDLDGYYQFLQRADVVDFLSSPEIQYIQDSVHDPQQSNHPEQRCLETGGDGSSDTYWPIHSDLDAPGLDLGWPHLHHFIGPTEVTTLVNPPEPDMPSIKEQARRLIKNAHQVIAIVMNMFTDVDIFHDILNAAMRNVAVYVLLDEQNAHHFLKMVSNCRVNLQSIQFLRVRTVSGITYHCRSGKSFEGQMMDCFLLTDCRAVLSGNYSFMWSFEKLHRCMAHLFLGQLVSTFDEEFRILFAQSRPLTMENVLATMEDHSLLQKRQYPSERTSLYREPRKFRSMDAAHSEEWARHSCDERMDMDWRMMPLKKKETVHDPADIYSRFPFQQSRMDPSFEQGPSRMPMMESPAFKRHSYAEGVYGRYSFLPGPENQGRQFHRGHQPYPGHDPGKEADYSAYDKFWNQDHLSDQYSEPGLLQEMEPPDNFDPVLNYLSSTRNVDFDQSSDKLPPAADLPLGSSHPRRLSLGQPYACQTSPTPTNPTEQKPFFLEPNTDRKDPVVKRGLRDWRISSYLSAYDNPGDEGLPLAPPNAADPFEEPSNITQQTTPGIDLSVPKIPNVREFKVPAIPRASQMPAYAKSTAREQTKKSPDEPTAEAVETKRPPTPSELSSTAKGEKTEEVEPMEPKTAVVHREESFRRKYNAATPRSSRLRYSLIFSSMEQQHTSQDTKTASGQQDEESEKNEAEQTKQTFVSQGLGQRRSTAKGPFEWSRYMKSATFDNSATDPSKPDNGNSKAEDKDSSKDENSKDVQESLKPPDVEQANSSPSVPESKPAEAELHKTDQPIKPPKSLLTSPLYVDMNDPDTRLMFFKELAAKRKAAKAAEAEKSKEKAPMKPPTELKNNGTLKKAEPATQGTAEKMADTTTSEGPEQNVTAEDGKTVSTEKCESVSLSLAASDKTDKDDGQVENDPNTSQSPNEEQSRVSADSEKIELKDSQPAATLTVPAEPEAPQSEPSEKPKLSNPTVEKSSSSHPPTPTHVTPPNVPSLAQGTDESENLCLDSTSKDSGSLTTSSVEVQPSASALDSDISNPESVQVETSISSPPLLSEQHSGPEFSSSNPIAQSSSSDHTLPDSGSRIHPSSSPSSSIPPSSPADTISSNVTTDEWSSALTSPILSPNAQEAVSPLAQSVEETSQKSAASSIIQTESESTQDHLDSVSQLTSSETASAVESAHVASDISLDTYAAGSEPNASSLQSTTKADSEESCAPKVEGEKYEVLGSSNDVKADSTPPSPSPSSPELCLPNVADLESKSRSDQKEIIIPTPSAAGPLPEHSSAETSSPAHPDLTPNASQSETTASLQDTPIQVTPPSELNLTQLVTRSLAETVSCSSPSESVYSVLSPEAETTLSALHSSSDNNSLPQQVTTDTMLPSTEPTSNIPTETDLPCKTPESVTSETQPSEPSAPAENSDMDNQNEVSQEPETPDPVEKNTDDTETANKINTTAVQESACSEKTNDQERQNNCSQPPVITSDEAVPPSPQSKQPKSSQSRYLSSTANVLSSSNLRDDTKLLLEQISANSQSRNEATKESPVTDDEKEDEADKNAKREKERGMRSFSRGQPKSNQEREKVLEKIQSMRKERKVYSRFEMAP